MIDQLEQEVVRRSWRLGHRLPTPMTRESRQARVAFCTSCGEPAAIDVNPSTNEGTPAWGPAITEPCPKPWWPHERPLRVLGLRAANGAPIG